MHLIKKLTGVFTAVKNSNNSIIPDVIKTRHCIELLVVSSVPSAKIDSQAKTKTRTIKLRLTQLS